MCSADYQPSVCANVIVVGGNARIPGMGERMYVSCMSAAWLATIWLSYSVRVFYLVRQSSVP